MAKGERTVNPATAHLKSEKARALKKSKNQLATQRQEKLARRNPDRLQKQIDELKATQEAQGGQLRPKDKQTLEQLERDVKAVRKARDGLQGRDDREVISNRRNNVDKGTILGKRQRDSDFRRREQDDDSEPTDEDVRTIPMPRDTPPPIPRARPPLRRVQDSSSGHGPNGLPAKPLPVSQAVYSSAPQIRNLQKESTSKFVPAAVAAKLKQSKGEGGRYLEPDEVDRLEKSGYIVAEKVANAAAKEEAYNHMASDQVAYGGGSLEEEEAAFERELRTVEALEGAGPSLTAAETKELKASAQSDIGAAVEEATKEAQYRMMVEDQTSDARDSQGRRDAERIAERQLRHVEIEEVEDEEG